MWVLALALGAALRALPLSAAHPYIAYVDEGNFLHGAFRLVRNGGWTPDSYLYPQLPVVAVVASARALDPLARSVRGRSLGEGIPDRPELYDDLEPFPILWIARVLSLALGMTIVVLTGLLARRLGGPHAGAAAALLAAVAPALVLRGSIALVDPYAAFFALACVSLADATRTARRPGLIAFFAGAMAGAVFASKYPAVLVFAALVVTILIQSLPPREALRRLGLAGLGLLLGGAAAMPAALAHPREVLAALRFQYAAYAQFTTPPLWRQALFRAEPDVPYEGPELGLALIALALGGVVVGLRDRRSRPAVAGWCAFAAASLALYSLRPFQPFRNCLPLVPLVCASAALFYAALRRCVRAPLLADALGLLAVLALFVPPLSRYALARRALVDPRTAAVDWLSARVRPGDGVLVVKDLGILSQELARLGTAPAPTPTSVWWEQAEAAITQQRPRFVVAGVLSRMDGSTLDASAAPVLAASYAVRLTVGHTPTAPSPGWWRGNDEIVTVFERR